MPKHIFSKQLVYISLAPLVLSLSSSMPVRADDAAAPDSNQTSQNMPSVSAGQLITASAKVEKVDLKNREVTLKGAEGKPFTIEVPENVKRLDNVKPGDTLRVAFYESVAISLQKPGEAPLGESGGTMGERAAGKLPGGAVTKQVTATAKITKIDLAKNEIWIEGPNGKKNSIEVKDPQNQAALKKLKVGDEIQATFTEAEAVQVTAPKPQG